VHVGLGRCGWAGLGIRIRSDMVSRSATFAILCRLMRHFAALVAIERGIARGWYQAGSWAHSCGDRRIAARLTWYFLAVCSICIMLSFRRRSLAPQVGASHACKKVFIRAR
jgi:hypothetical protein